MRITSANLQKQQKCLNKLRLIDQHIIRTTSNTTAAVGFEEVTRLLALKLASQPPKQLMPYTPKVILFQELRPKKFMVRGLTADQDKKFILKVQSHVPALIGISVNQSKSKMFNVQGNKAVVIVQTSWNELIVSIEVERLGPFSSVRILLEQMKTQHKNPKKIGVNLRPNIKGELDEYLKQARGKSADIIRSRSMAKLKENSSRKRISSTARETPRQSSLVRTKSELFKFEKRKDFYIRHVERMSPQKIEQFKSSKVIYDDGKYQQMVNLSKLIMIAKMGIHIRDEASRIKTKKLRQIKISLLCMQFVKIIKNKFKLKMTEMARLRMTNLHYINHMPAMMHEGCVKRARQTVLQALMPYMQFRGLQQLAQYSEQYIKGVKLVQTFYRSSRFVFLQRIKILCDRLCIIYNLTITQKARVQISHEYYKRCQSISKFKFSTNKEQLLQMIRQRVQ